MKKKVIIISVIWIAVLMLAGCEDKKNAAPAEIDIDEVYEKIITGIEMPEMIKLSDKRMFNILGIDREKYTEAITSVCGDSLRADEIWLIKADSAEEKREIKALAQARIDQKCAENENYLPEQYTVAKNGKIVECGNCIALFISPENEQMQKILYSTGNK